LEKFKPHNSNNAAEERFNKIERFNHLWMWESNWEWKYNSVVIFGGFWNATSSSGSRCSSWGDSPSGSDSYVSARHVCRGLK
jgi:hypothetical protein